MRTPVTCWSYLRSLVGSVLVSRCTVAWTLSWFSFSVAWTHWQFSFSSFSPCPPCMSDVRSQWLWHDNLGEMSEWIDGMARLQWVKIYVTGRVMGSCCSLPLSLSSTIYPLAACKWQVKPRYLPISAKLASSEPVTQIKPFFFLVYCCLLHNVNYCLPGPTFYLPIGIKLPFNSNFTCLLSRFSFLVLKWSFCILLLSLHFEDAFLVFTVFRRLSSGSFNLKYFKCFVYFR